MSETLMYRLPPGCVAVKLADGGAGYQAFVCEPPTTLTYEGRVAVVAGTFSTADEACEAGFSVLGGLKGAEGDEEAQGEFPFKNPDGH